MSTLAQMRSRIADDINRSDINSQIDKAINRAIEHYYKSERFWFNETVSTALSTVASQEAYSTSDSLPSDIVQIDYISIQLSSTNYQKLNPRTFQWIQETNVSRSTGTPSDYAWYRDRIYLYPIPNAAKTLNIFYRKSYSALSADGDSNDFTSYAEDLIEARATWWINSRILRNYDAAKISKDEEMQALQALRTRTESIIPSSDITPTFF